MLLSVMLRIYFLQQWYNFSDPGVEERLFPREVGVHDANLGVFSSYQLAFLANLSAVSMSKRKRDPDMLSLKSWKMRWPFLRKSYNVMTNPIQTQSVH